MKYYKDLLKMGAFTLGRVVELVGGNVYTAKSILGKYTRKGYVASVKRGLYVALDLASGAPAVNVWRIASAITPTSYVSHISAMTYYGLADQVRNVVYVSSETQFKPFVFDGTEYRYIASRMMEGVVSEDDVRVSDRERTVIDCIDSFDRIGGLEELLRTLAMLTHLDTAKLVRYLELYDKAVLWQKTGFILEHFKDSLKLSDEFFQTCHARKGGSRRYLTELLSKDRQSFVREWGLMAPADLMSIAM